MLHENDELTKLTTRVMGLAITDQGVISLKERNSTFCLKLVVFNKLLKSNLKLLREQPIFLTRSIDVIHDGRHVGFAIIMQISYTLLRGQTTQVREVITNILATQMICFTFMECLSPKR